MVLLPMALSVFRLRRYQAPPCLRLGRMKTKDMATLQWRKTKNGVWVYEYNGDFFSPYAA